MAGPEVAALREPDVALTADEREAGLRLCPAHKFRDDLGRVAVVDQYQLGYAFLIPGEHRVDSRE